MLTEELMQGAQKYLMDTYTRYPLALARGQGTRVFDVEGREYLDFLAGVAVNVLATAIRKSRWRCNSRPCGWSIPRICSIPSPRSNWRGSLSTTHSLTRFSSATAGRRPTKPRSNWRDGGRMQKTALAASRSSRC